MTDVADTEKLLRIIQSIPSPKAEPFKIGKKYLEFSNDWIRMIMKRKVQ